MSGDILTLRGADVTLRDIERVARRHAAVTLGESARERIIRARAAVDRAIDSGIPVYGVTTALGANTGASLARDELAAYQRRAVEARAVGIGPALPTDVVRAIMAARLCGMAVGGSGVAVEVVDSLAAMLNAGIHPIVPSRGSIGAADLAPLAHLALPLIGEGYVECDGAILPGGAALASAGIDPIDVSGKDALSIISSNAAMLGHAALVLVDVARALDLLTTSVALMHEAFRANVGPLDARVQRARRAPAQERIAERLRSLLEPGAIARPGAARRLQDPVSLRCAVQVHGALLGALWAARDLVERDLNAATESPLVIAETAELVSNGNFDTTDIAVAFEALGLCIAHAAFTGMQRCQRLYTPATSDLPLQLTRHGPAHSGFATVQKTLLSLTAEIRRHARPVTLDALPVSEAIEDHASLAPLVVAKTAAMLPLVKEIIAIELMSAAQAIDLRGTGDAMSPAMRAAYERVRGVVRFVDHDRPLGPDIDALAATLDGDAWGSEGFLA